LGFNRVLAGSIERHDAQVLLDPFEEQLNLPAAFVERCDGSHRQCSVVGQEHQRLACFGVAEANAAQVAWIILAAVVTVEGDALIGEDARLFIQWMGVNTAGIEITFLRELRRRRQRRFRIAPPENVGKTKQISRLRGASWLLTGQ
jgi:uncharacterized protein YfiM (DUF2279 family)